MVCNSVNQPVKNEIPIALWPALLGDTLNATRPNADDPSTDESSSESEVLAILLRRSTRQKRPALSCTVCNQNKGVQDKCGSLHPWHKKVCAYVALLLRKTCQFRTHKCHPQASPTEDQGGACSSGFKGTKFCKVGGLIIVSKTWVFCKCLAVKRYKTWEATGAISAIWKTVTCKSTTTITEMEGNKKTTKKK